MSLGGDFDDSLGAAHAEEHEMSSSEDVEYVEPLDDNVMEELTKIVKDMTTIFTIAKAWHLKVDESSSPMLDYIRGPVHKHLLDMTTHMSAVETDVITGTVLSLIDAKEHYDLAQAAHEGMWDTLIPHVIDEMPTPDDLKEAEKDIMNVDGDMSVDVDEE